MIRRILGTLLAVLVVITVVMVYSVKIPKPETDMVKEIPFDQLPK